MLPLAITVQVCQQVLEEAGFDPHLVTLAAENPDDKLAATLAVRPEVKLIDYTGGNAFGDWLEENARQAVVFTEKAGVNTVVVDSTSSFAGMCQNLAFSFALYTGQMCTAPQNVYLPADGIETDEGHKSVAEVGAGLGAAFDKLLGDDARAVELLGGVVNGGRARAPRCGGLARRGAGRRRASSPTRRTTTRRSARPPIIGLTAADSDVYENECFGPVAYLIATAGHRRVDPAVPRHRAPPRRDDRVGLLDLDEVVADVREAALDAGVALSENLLGGVFVNQSAAYSDFHGTGANPAANASYTDGAYVASRFRIVQSRRHV